VAFLERLRDERRFPGPDALVAQIRADIAEARRTLGVI
jgi:FAD synthase